MATIITFAKSPIASFFIKKGAAKAMKYVIDRTPFQKYFQSMIEKKIPEIISTVSNIETIVRYIKYQSIWNGGTVSESCLIRLQQIYNEEDTNTNEIFDEAINKLEYFISEIVQFCIKIDESTIPDTEKINMIADLQGYIMQKHPLLSHLVLKNRINRTEISDEELLPRIFLFKTGISENQMTGSLAFFSILNLLDIIEIGRWVSIGDRGKYTIEIFTKKQDDLLDYLQALDLYMADWLKNLNPKKLPNNYENMVTTYALTRSKSVIQMAQRSQEHDDLIEFEYYYVYKPWSPSEQRRERDLNDWGKILLFPVKQYISKFGFYRSELALSIFTWMHDYFPQLKYPVNIDEESGEPESPEFINRRLNEICRETDKSDQQMTILGEPTSLSEIKEASLES